MSLVQAVLCSEFALVCGEQQLNLTSGGVLHNFRKIFKVNEAVIIGLSGAIEDNYYLFQDYLNVDFTLKEDCPDGDNRHYDNFLAGVYRYGAEVYGLQRAFRDTLAQGVMFDEYIDKNAQFELIRRPVV